MKFYKLLDDKMIKNIANKDIGKKYLLEIVNLILKTNYSEMELLNTNISENNMFVKGKNMDLYFKEDNTNICIEANNVLDFKTIEKNLAYIFSIYGNNVRVSDDYNTISKTIQINFSRKSQSKLMKDIFMLKNSTNEIFRTDKLEIYEFDVEKAKRECYTIHDDENKLNKYIAMMVANKKELIEISKGDKILEELAKEVINMNNNSEYREFITYEEDQIKRHKTDIINYYNNGFKNGESLGKLEGIKEGKLEGIKEGKLEGIKEGKIDTAKSLVKAGFDAETICKVLKLDKKLVM